MVLRSDPKAKARFNGCTHAIALGLLAFSSIVVGCIPKRSCEFTRTCPPETHDAGPEDTVGVSTSSSQSNSGVSIGDASVVPLDGASPADASLDAEVAPTPIIACVRSTDCTPELPFCEDTAKVCTGCRADRDCKGDDATLCLLVGAEPQNNSCVECLTSENCDDGVCLDNACVTCNADTDEGCDGATPLCASIAGVPTCVACEVDVDCADTPETPTCSAHVCKACSVKDPSHCAAETPVCVEEASSARCVACTESSHCQLTEDGGSAGSAQCIEEQCTTCVLGTNDGCPTAFPFCAALVPETGDAGVAYLAPSPSETPTANQYLEYQHVCVECINNQACGASSSRPGCFDGTCVQCTEDAHCKDPSASVCDTSTHTCVGCQAIGDCAHQTGTKTTACDIEHRTCVECTAVEDTCDDKACQTVPGDDQYTCSDVNKGQTSPCFECVSDSACSAGSNCIRDTYEGTDGGWRCLKREPALGNGDTCADLKVFDTALETTSIDGVAGPYCHPRLTSCQGYRHYGEGPVAGESGQDTCLSNEDCGLPGVDDGFCVSISANANRCTYGCVSAQDCAVSLSCGIVTAVDDTDAQVCSL
jgi:hypothetical protein